jgi:hypothetical protein
LSFHGNGGYTRQDDFSFFLYFQNIKSMLQKPSGTIGQQLETHLQRKQTTSM